MGLPGLVVSPDAPTVGNRPASRNRPPYRPSVRLDGPMAPMLLSPDRALPVGGGRAPDPERGPARATLELLGDRRQRGAEHHRRADPLRRARDVQEERVGSQPAGQRRSGKDRQPGSVVVSVRVFSGSRQVVEAVEWGGTLVGGAGLMGVRSPRRRKAAQRSRDGQRVGGDLHGGQQGL